MDSGQEHFQLDFDQGVWSVEFSHDGRLLATTANDSIIRLWDIDELVSASSPQDVRRMAGHSNLVNGLAFGPDDGQLASTSTDGTVRLWDVATGEELLTFGGFVQRAWGVTFSPDGKRLATVNWDGTVRVFLLELDEVVALAQERLVRWFSGDECRFYLDSHTCPQAPWEE